jgi:hypothetical protein
MMDHVAVGMAYLIGDPDDRRPVRIQTLKTLARISQTAGSDEL